VHQTVIKAEGFRSLNQGDAVEFKLIQDHKGISFALANCCMSLNSTILVFDWSLWLVTRAGLHAEEVTSVGGSLLPASLRPQPKQPRASAGLAAPAGFINPHGLAPTPYAYHDPRFAFQQQQGGAASGLPVYAAQAGSPLIPSAAYYSAAAGGFVGGIPVGQQAAAASQQQSQQQGNALESASASVPAGRPQRGGRGSFQQQSQQVALPQSQGQSVHSQQGAYPAVYGNLQGGQPTMFAGPNGSLYSVMPYPYGMSPVAFDPNSAMYASPLSQQQSQQQQGQSPVAAPQSSQAQPVGKVQDLSNMMAHLQLQQQSSAQQSVEVKINHALMFEALFVFLTHLLSFL
jgi:hypothetical protein